MAQRSTHLDSLDAVRGAAIIMVVAFHLWFNTVPLLGDAGVDLFFVLSGYLIGGILIDCRESDRLFSTFYARRAFRILPLYGLLIVAGGLPAHEPVWWFLTFTQNLGWAATRSFPVGAPVSVTWSLSVEEQFYLLLPMLVRVLPPRALAGVLWVGVILAPLWRWGVWHFGPLYSFLLLPCRLDGLMCGTLVAWLQRSDIRANLYWLPLALAGPLLDGALHYLDPSYRMPQLSALSLAFAAILCLATQLRKPFPLVLRPLCWTGTGAYAIYLFHLLALRWCGDDRWLTLLVVCLFAGASWFCIERPLIGFARARWRYREIRPRWAISGSATALPR